MFALSNNNNTPTQAAKGENLLFLKPVQTRVAASRRCTIALSSVSDEQPGRPPLLSTPLL